MRALLTSLILAAAAAATAAQANPPPKNWLTSDQVLGTKANLPGQVRLGSLTVTFEKTRLSDVLAAAPGGQIAGDGEAGEARSWLCYTLPRQQRLWVISSGEMGGPDHAVTAVMLAADAEPAAADCPAAPALAPASLGVPLGSGVPAMKAAFGEAGLDNGSQISWLANLPVDGKPQCTLQRTVDASTAGGGANVIRVGQITAC